VLRNWSIGSDLKQQHQQQMYFNNVQNKRKKFSDELLFNFYLQKNLINHGEIPFLQKDMACIFFQDESSATPAEEKEKFSGEIPISKLKPDMSILFLAHLSTKCSG